MKGEDERGRRSPPPVPGGIGGGLFGGMGAPRDPHGRNPPGRPEPDPMLVLGGLVDTLRMAGLRANPRHVRDFWRGRGRLGMGPDDLPDNLSDDEEPRVKITPPIFKGTPRRKTRCPYLCSRRLDEAMRVRRDDYIIKFKHTLNHLAREWYHSLDLDQFGGDWG